jgi:hypothetical protein
MRAIRKNIGFGQGRRAENGVKHENFFVAKICDSESTHKALGGRGGCATIFPTHDAHDE